MDNYTYNNTNNHKNNHHNETSPLLENVESLEYAENKGDTENTENTEKGPFVFNMYIIMLVHGMLLLAVIAIITLLLINHPISSKTFMIMSIVFGIFDLIVVILSIIILVVLDITIFANHIIMFVHTVVLGINASLLIDYIDNLIPGIIIFNIMTYLTSVMLVSNFPRFIIPDYKYFIVGCTGIVIIYSIENIIFCVFESCQITLFSYALLFTLPIILYISYETYKISTNTHKVKNYNSNQFIQSAMSIMIGPFIYAAL